MSSVASVNSENLVPLVADLLLTLESRPTLVFISWWADFSIEILEKLDSLLAENCIPWATICNASGILRCTNPEVTELLFWSRVSDGFKALISAYYWDTLDFPLDDHGRHERAQKLAEFHPYDRDTNVQTEQVEERVSGRQIGFLGSQMAHRGIGEFIWLGCLNPSVLFVGLGATAVSSWRLDIYRFPRASGGWSRRLAWRFVSPLQWIEVFISGVLLLLARALPNIHLKQHTFPTQSEFNMSLQSFDAIFIAAHRHPYSSGTALQALACGTPVLWIAGNSAANDHLRRQYPLGRLNWRDFLIPGYFGQQMPRRLQESQCRPVFVWDDYLRDLSVVISRSRSWRPNQRS